MPSDDKLISITNYSYTPANEQFIYDIDINQTFVSTSPLVTFENNFNSTGAIAFCTKVSTTYGEGADEINVSFRKSNFNIDFNMTATFGGSFLITADNIFETDLDVDSVYSVGLCQCNNSFSCITDASPVQQNDYVSLCLKPNSTDVNISNFNLKMISGEYSYEPWSFESQSSDLATLTSSGNTKKLDAIVVEGLFEGGGDEVVVSGTAFLEFSGSRRSKKGDLATFRLSFDIEPMEPDCSNGNVFNILNKIGW